MLTVMILKFLSQKRGVRTRFIREVVPAASCEAATGKFGSAWKLSGGGVLRSVSVGKTRYLGGAALQKGQQDRSRCHQTSTPPLAEFAHTPTKKMRVC